MGDLTVKFCLPRGEDTRDVLIRVKGTGPHSDELLPEDVPSSTPPPYAQANTSTASPDPEVEVIAETLLVERVKHYTCHKCHRNLHFASFVYCYACNKKIQDITKKLKSLYHKGKDENIELTSQVDYCVAHHQSCGICIVCTEAPADHIILPCGHLICCGVCAWRIKQEYNACPGCRHTPIKIQKVYFSSDGENMND